ncbi:NAD-dependent epimerase/dehydratase family protein [Nonomuraea ferruginea]
MKIVVVGGTGLIGSKLVAKLAERGHEAVAASPSTGVNALTGEGLAEVLEGASVVVDVSKSSSFEESAVREFFDTSTRNLLAAEAEARRRTPRRPVDRGRGPAAQAAVLPGEGRPGEADPGVADPVLARTRHPVLRVRPEHRRRGDGRRQGADGARALPAHRG